MLFVPDEYYPNYYWVQPNAYPPPPRQNKMLPWLVVFVLTVASFYTIYLYIQPEFSLEGLACSERIVVIKLLTSKPGRFFEGEFRLVLPSAGIEYSLRTSDSVDLGEQLQVPVDVSLQPGTYRFDVYFRNNLLGQETCTVR